MIMRSNQSVQPSKKLQDCKQEGLKYYERPTLVEYGSVAILTQGCSGSKNDANLTPVTRPQSGCTPLAPARSAPRKRR